ncbi:MAG: hypothetical protein QF489_05670 [Planctomycetota bacterium]|jgi:hypothetical protein|nr:hypothetical protein [Planctomycetota bacterium]
MLTSFVLFAAALLSAQADEEKVGTGCNFCKNRGAVACDRHDKDLLPLEEQVHFCSVAANCKDCQGALLVDCKRCNGGPDSIKLEKRLLTFQRYLDSPVGPEELFKRHMPRVVTDHYDLIIDVEKLKDGSRKLNGHEVAHLMAVELEKAAALLNEHFGAKPFHSSRRTRIWYWNTVKDHKRVNFELLKQNSEMGFSLYGVAPASSDWAGANGLEFRAMNVVSNAVHKGTHLRLSNLFRVEWIGNKKAGWFDVGAAHWYEDKLFQRVSTYCIDEANNDLDYEGGKWRVAMRKYLNKHKNGILPELIGKVSGTLRDYEHALAWSLYDWVANEHPKALKLLLMGYKDRIESRDLFRKHLGMTVIQAEAAWREWVAATYPVKDPKPRKKL